MIEALRVLSVDMQSCSTFLLVGAKHAEVKGDQLEIEGHSVAYWFARLGK